MPLSVKDMLNPRRQGQPAIMGVLNVTPDSFADGGKFLDSVAAIAHARQMAADGVDIIDIGAESTRPGSEGVPPSQQIQRLEAILPAVIELGIPVSIDTTSAAVASFAADAGAVIINDISAGRSDEEMLPLVASRSLVIVLMHMLGRPKDMQTAVHYEDVVGEVRDFLAERLSQAQAAGVAIDNCLVDPGIGFGKLLDHNLALIAGLSQIVSLGRAVLVGPSRKRFIGQLTDQSEPSDRLPGTLAACLAAWQRGASILRVHDVRPLADALRVFGAIQQSNATGHDQV